LLLFKLSLYCFFLFCSTLIIQQTACQNKNCRQTAFLSVIFTDKTAHYFGKWLISCDKPAIFAAHFTSETLGATLNILHKKAKKNFGGLKKLFIFAIEIGEAITPFRLVR